MASAIINETDDHDIHNKFVKNTIAALSEEEQPPFKLKDGRVLADPAQSNVFSIIAAAHPERPSFLNPDGPTHDNLGMSDLFAKCYVKRVRYCPEQKAWYVYDGSVWKIDAGDRIAYCIQEFNKLMRLYSGEIDDQELCKKYLIFVAKIGDHRFREGMRADAEANEMLIIRPDEFDADPYLINCKNGTYDLKKGIFYESKADDLLTKQTAFNYSLKDPVYERWTEFIKEVTQGDEEKADYLQKALGYSILGKANEECMFILHGKTTRNGKSTMLSAIYHLLGDYAGVASVSIICKAGIKFNSANSPTPALADLKGKRFVTMAETGQHGKLDEEMIKQLTGGEEITVRDMYGKRPFSFLPQFTLWLSCNDLPAVRDKSLFASERLRVIEFNRHFKPDEQDKDLKTEFQTEQAMRGIFAWLIEGYRKYKREGLKMPDTVRNVVKQYERENDLVLSFLEEKCEVAPSENIRKKSLFDAFRMWSKSNGYSVEMTAHNFYNEVELHTEWYKRKNRNIKGYPVYDGLRLKASS